MAERSSSLACKKFSANLFDKNKCQDCFKTKDAHHDATTASLTSPQKPTSLQVGANRPRTTVKSGTLAIATQVSTLPDVEVQKWEKVWFMLYSSGVLEWFTSEATKTSLGSIILDDCTGLMSADVDTKEPFSIGIKTSPKTHYLKAENRLEMDNWCRVLKPFVIASPGYRFNGKSPTTRALSYHDSKINSSNNVLEIKPNLLRTVSAPWQASIVDNAAKKRWSATEELLTRSELADKYTESNGKTSEGTETAIPAEKQVDTQPESDAKLQPCFSDIYLKPEPSEQKQNGEICSATSTLESELADAKRVAKHSQGKAEMCSKNLASAKTQLEKANNVISIQKANIEALTSEVESLKARLKNSDEVLERRLAELDSRYPTCNGSTSRDSIESGFIKLQAKLQENEKALIRRTRELEKANESRKKVAKHTRALLVELEEKLTENNRRINELEEQLMNQTLDLQYEKEERKRIEQLTKDLSASSLYSKQREITKKSTELLQQAKEDYRLSKNEQKFQQEIESLNKKLQTRNFEIQKLQERLVGADKKDGEVQKLEAAYKKASEQLDSLRNELGFVNERYTKEKVKCNQLESRVQDICAKVTERKQKTKEIQDENAKMKAEIEKTRKESETQILLLQEDNETTRIKLREVQEELDTFHTETDGKNPDEFQELSRNFEELKSKSEKDENEYKKLGESQIETVRDFNNEKNKRLKLEKDFVEKGTELRNSKKELEKLQELLRISEEKFENESKRVSELEGICKSTEENAAMLKAKSSLELKKLQEEMENYQNEINKVNARLDGSNREVLDLREELEKRMKTEEQILNKIDDVESTLNETQSDKTNTNALPNTGETKCDRANVIDAIVRLGEKVEILKSSLKEETSRANSLKQTLQTKQSASTSCSNCEKRKNNASGVAEELEEAKESYRKELERLQESMKSESQTLKSHAGETKLKLTSKVILLQSDISELNAKHEQELKQVNEQHKQEVASCRDKHARELQLASERHQQDMESWREKCESLSGSNNEEIGRLREKVGQLEEQLLSELQSNERRIETLRQEYEAKEREDEVNENGVVSLTELEEVKQRHNKELEEIKENHRKELEENKSDMMMVLQALKSDSYQSSSMSSESLEMNDEFKKLERYVETLKKEHEQELERLNAEHEQDLEQLRSDMVTLLRVQETYKTSDEDKADPNGNIVDLDGQLVALKQLHEREIREKEAQHQTEVDQLKSDMLVAIQAASAVGNIGSQASAVPQTSSDERVTELEQYIANLEREFEEERETLQNAIKKAESATKFGLRRNEEMSTKIYQMQREMEEIDTKYQKEIKLYKQAFDQEKNRKTTIGAVPGILAENESLKVKLQELELSMEQMQVRYDSEIKRYKEKFQQDNVLTVEELQLKIKSLEDTIGQMRLEHDAELERYTKAVKRGKVSLAGTAKERDLERKIDDLESKIDVMRQKHREESRKYRERLEDEMELHRKEVSESRAKVRKLEADSRQMEDLKNRVTELEAKNGKLTKDSSKYKEQEDELNETKSKNRELQRQVDVLKRKLDKLEEAAEENQETSNEATVGSSRAKLSRYSSCDNIGLSSTARTKAQTGGDVGEARPNEGDVFEMNNNSGKSEVAGYKLNPGLKRPASVSAFPVLNENGSRRTTYNEKRRDSGSTSSRPTYQTSYLKSSSSASNLK